MTTTTIVCEKTSRPYRREEDDDAIRWFKDTDTQAEYIFRKKEKLWRNWRQNLVKGYGEDIALEKQYQEQQNLQAPAQLQYRLVSRGQSFTGEEIIELHVYNHPRGIWQKMPVKVTINPELNWTLEELENWTKESWSTH